MKLETSDEVRLWIEVEAAVIASLRGNSNVHVSGGVAVFAGLDADAAVQEFRDRVTDSEES